MQVFRWHDRARLFGPDGTEQYRDVPFNPLPRAHSGPRALAAALQGATGAAFRIGGEGELHAGFGEFEALTGGSLGSPRRVVRSQDSWIHSFAVNARIFGIDQDTRVATLGSLVHSLSLYACLEALYLGADLHVLEGLRPDRRASEMARRDINLLYATPAQLRPVMSVKNLILPGLRHVIIGGARLDAGLRDMVRRAAPNAMVHEFYGSAETSFITLSSGDETGETVGQPYPGVHLRLGPDGQIWVQSPYLFRGYAGDDPGSARWKDEWLTVGEVGELRPDGLVLKGRSGRMITVADRNVFPEQIEVFLLGLPGIDRAAIVPVADSARGHVLLAFLMGDRAEEDAIRAALLAKLGPMISPKALIWHDDWPVLPSGKTDLAQLAAKAPAWR